MKVNLLNFLRKKKFNSNIIYVVDATGKKIRGTADDNIKDYDHYGEYTTTE